MRIMLDTNILISLFVFPGGRMSRLKQLLVKQQIVLCSYVVEETKDVMERKFPDRVGALDEFFQSLPFVMTYSPECFDKTAYPAMRDDYDVPILVSAILEDVDVLISGDKDFLAVDVEKPEILTPTEYIEQYGNGE